jgi:type II secretory pathway predicted ATPase ExeA
MTKTSSSRACTGCWTLWCRWTEKIVLIIDEAQSLSEDLLRAARFFQTSHLIPGGRLAILLVAQQELNKVLSHPRNEGLTPADHHWLFARCPGAA